MHSRQVLPKIRYVIPTSFFSPCGVPARVPSADALADDRDHGEIDRLAGMIPIESRLFATAFAAICVVPNSAIMLTTARAPTGTGCFPGR